MFDSLSSAKKALVVVAHPDDEVLLAGGLISRLAAEGATVSALSFTDGVSSRQGAKQSDAIQRDKAADQAAELLGFGWWGRMSLPDQQLDLESIPSLVAAVETALVETNPDLVITHSGSDLNGDHRRVLEAVMVATRPMPDSKRVTLVSGEVVSATHWSAGLGLPPFNPTLFVDVTDTFSRKIGALEAYASEMRQFPHARSSEAVEALARFRGSTVGVERAEAFELIRAVMD